jgi:ABC-type transport system substrate-binding protein
MEWSTRLAMMAKGDIDFLSPGGIEKYIPELEQIEGVKVDVPGMLPTFYHIQYDCWRPPFDQKIVRQALSWAVPYDDLVEIGTEGQGARSFGYYALPGAPGNIGLEGAKYTFDLDKAQELLVQAGFPEGTGLGKEIEICTSSYNPALTEMAVVLKETWKDLGIESKVVIYSDPVLWEKAISGDLDVVIGGWGGSPYSQYTTLNGIMHSSGIATGYNNQHFNSSAMDELLDRITASTDVEERAQLMDEAVIMMFDEASLIPIYNIPMVYAYQPWVTVTQMQPGIQSNLQSAYFDGIYKVGSN